MTSRSPQRGRPHRRRDERGLSLSVFMVLGTLALILMIGLVVDGGQKVQAARQAEAAASGAARAGVDAGATARLGNTVDRGRSITAARAHLAGSESVTGSVELRGNRVVVHASSTRPTLFLSLIGITQVTARASAEADLFGN